ncbi:MAG TPA: Fe-S oxidoreductase [Gemmatimonadetes bacterium]|nr:Fe-S oxidoreductase [Gemmatimonadota bacterium]HCO13331.1 Fe-S oxidoreductase [Gemmatimonadota bacterium]
MKVALFATCIGDHFFADACADSVRLLRHVGAEVSFPEGQTCCGQPAYNSGHRSEAQRVMAHTLDVFSGADYVVLPSGSCAGMLRAVYPGLAASDALRAASEDMSARTYELSQFLVEVAGVDRLGDGLEGRRIAYHHGCHALRELGVMSEPLSLLRGAGADVVSWAADRECCGFGGTFSGKLPEVSAAMADHKLETLPAVDSVTSSDGGCLLQLSGRVERRGLAVPFQHLATLLWQGVTGNAGNGVAV